MGIKNTPPLILLALILAGQAAPAAAQSPAVPLVTAQPAGAAGTYELDGTIQAVRQATVAAQVGGNVQQLMIKAGDRVKAGQPIARVDAREAQAGLLRSEAGVAQAEAELRNARVQLDRTRELRQQGFVSQSALDVVETQYKAAQAGAQQAAAGRSQAALARDFTTLTAPFDAVVLATHLEAGDLAAPGRAVATLYAPGAMRAVVQVPSSRAGAARAAQKAAVRLPDGRSITPESQTVLPSADPVSQTVEWRLDLPAAALDGLLPGQAVRVAFAGAPTAAAAAGPGGRLSVPTAAVLRRGELTAVYVAQDKGFALRAVRLGASTGDAVDVLAGLRAGERVAANAVQAGLAGAQPAAAR
jgi:RND family efflux transporter MFP subunit